MAAIVTIVWSNTKQPRARVRSHATVVLSLGIVKTSDRERAALRSTQEKMQAVVESLPT